LNAIDADAKAPLYGGNVYAYTMSPYIIFGSKGGSYDSNGDWNYLPFDSHRQNRGRRWSVYIAGSFYETDDAIKGAGAVWSTSADLMRCLVCFDVKKEDAELEEGHKGIGGCGQKIKSEQYYRDGNFFGTVEAQGSDSF